LPAVDGLRAISILGVLAFHGVNFLHYVFGRGGWLGVDIFFVISGFLISRLAFAEIERSGSFNVKRFFTSRLLRISPAVWVMLAFCAIFNPFNTVESVNIKAITIAALNMTDYDLALQWGNSGKSLVAVCWSLAIEEKFYLLFPFLMLFYKRFRTPAVIIVLIILAESWKAYLINSGVEWVRITAAFDTRFDEILFGCLGASILAQAQGVRQPARQYVARAMSVLAHPVTTTLIAFAAWYLLRHFMHPTELITVFQKQLYWLVFVPVFATLISLLLMSFTVAQSNGRVSWLAKLLSSRPMLAMGKLSYSIYLWHSVAFFTITQVLGDVGIVSDLAKVALTIVISSASYFLIEKPFLTIKKRMAVRSLNLKLDGGTAGGAEKVPVTVSTGV